ncbi:calcium-binding protein [Sphingomonas sp. Root1294]|nr:calcium-binding protein [Sphingomonas sp. Root1294]
MDADFIALVRPGTQVLVRTSTELVVSTVGVADVDGRLPGTFSFSGEGVRYNDDGEPISGIITGVQISDIGGHVTSLTGLHASASDFFQLLNDISSGRIQADPLKLLLPGNDELRGTAGEDVLRDVAGHNIFIGGAGRDTIIGGDGNDHIYGHSPSGGGEDDDALLGDGGSDYIHGNAGNDYISGGDGSDRLYGGQGQDSISGDAGNDTVNGNLGDDVISGEDGHDVLRGGQGNDTITGGDGNDILMGDRGVDLLDGGDGANIFVFGPDTSPIGATMRDVDSLAYFSQLTDHFSLGFEPDSILVGGRDASLATPEQARAYAQTLLDQHAGNREVAFIYASGQTVMLWASNGGGTVDSAVLIDGGSFDYVGGGYAITTDHFI